MKRRLFQFFGSLLQNAYFAGFINHSIYQGSAKEFNAPTLNCYACPGSLFACPIGTLQHFVIVQAVPWYVVGYVAAIGAVVGRMTCGWLCPIGYGQDLLYKIKTVKIPIPKVLLWAKYLILVGVVLIVTHLFEEPWFSKLCPAGLVLAGIPWSLMDQAIRDMLRHMFWIKLGITFGYITWSTSSKRPFCRTTCPLGTVYSFFNSFSFWQMRVDQSSCTRCGRCRDVCPMDISIYENTRSVECIRCLECTACPCVEHRSILSLLPAPSRRPGIAGAETW